MLGHDPLASSPLAALGFTNAVVGAIATTADITGYADTNPLGLAPGGGGSGGFNVPSWVKKAFDPYYDEARVAKVKRDARYKKSYDDRAKREAQIEKDRLAREKALKLAVEDHARKEAEARDEGVRMLEKYVSDMHGIIQQQRLLEEEEIIALLLAG